MTINDETVDVTALTTDERPLLPVVIELVWATEQSPLGALSAPALAPPTGIASR
jgi:hypothetical protein